MTPMPVVPTFDPFKDSHLGFGVAFEATAVQQLTLERSEKTLRHRVVVGITDGLELPRFDRRLVVVVPR
jgi:hypothetical protein